ncbi:MAG: 30S ribosomal protein S11, chloroplastic [Paramarteilia canceri]
MTVAAEQTQAAFQYQRQTGPSKARRYVRSVGLGIKTPESAIKGKYVDKKCPFTGNVSIRGRILRAEVHSVKMIRTIICRVNYLHYNQKYKCYEKRHKNIPAHMSPCFDEYHVQKGDKVTIGECRPLSKTVKFTVLSVNKDMKKLKAFKKF